MRTLVVFLNELSLASSMSPGDMLPHVLATLAAVRAAKKVRNDLSLASQTPLTRVAFGDGTQSLATILRSAAHKDEWRSLSSLTQLSPWDSYPGLNNPGESREVVFQEKVAIGMLWANQNKSAILSFAFVPSWSKSHVRAQFHEMDGGGKLTPSEIAVPNLSKLEHVEVHHDLIANYGRELSSSSLIHEGDGFAIRIWFNDHNPPHFHVLARKDTSESLAKCAIETLDILSGGLPPILRNRVREWARDQREDLMRCWERCRIGQPPYAL